MTSDVTSCISSCIDFPSLMDCNKEFKPLNTFLPKVASYQNILSQKHK